MSIVVLAFIQAAGRPVTMTEISKASGIDSKTVSAALAVLAAEKIVKQHGGRWKIMI
ncbi:MAG: helix-turn-helix domain-containing protein [Succinivibrionaceae bacterium]|nr:helix-turn-helix domain-containing protein [Succinivibrionaceae bacterium]